MQAGPDSLADELWQNILCQLSLVDVLNCSRVNKRFHSVSQHDTVWTCLYLDEFDSTGHPQLSLSWKDIFRERFCCYNRGAAPKSTFLHCVSAEFSRAQRERVRLKRKRQASLVRLQSKVQVRL